MRQVSTSVPNDRTSFRHRSVEHVLHELTRLTNRFGVTSQDIVEAAIDEDVFEPCRALHRTDQRPGTRHVEVAFGGDTVPRGVVGVVESNVYVAPVLVALVRT